MLKLPKMSDQQFAVFMVCLVLTSILMQAIVLSVVSVPHVERIEVEILREPFQPAPSLEDAEGSSDV